MGIERLKQNYKTILLFMLLVVVFRHAFEWVIIAFFAGLPLASLGVWLLVILGAFGVFNIPRLFK